jgi:heat-inducible transcriptional repressor
MEERLLQLLETIVEEYISTAEPVGSQSLVDRHHLDVSSATIRNWCTELEEAGFLTQPHTSGGRVPTEEGFRTYVREFVREKPASKRERELLEKAKLVTDESDRKIKNIAKALADLSNQAVVVGLAEADTFYTGLSQLFAQPEFKNWQRVVSLTEVLDRLDDALNAMRKNVLTEPRVFLGRECPFGPACGCVMVSLPHGFLGILGPLRMDYQHGLSLIQTTLQLLNA